MRLSQWPRWREAAHSVDSAHESSQTNNHRMRRGRRPLVAGTAAVLIALLVTDLVSSVFYRTDTTMSVIRSGPPGESPRTLLVFPGYLGDCQSTFDAFSPSLDATWTLVVLCYAERGIDDDQVFSLLRSDVESAPLGSVSILAGSMGGMVAVTFLDRLARESTESRPQVELFLDTVPSNNSLVKRPQLAFCVAHFYRGGVVASFWWRLINTSDDNLDYSALEPNADIDIVERGNQYFRRIGMASLTSQAQYIDEFELAAMHDFQRVVSSAVFIKATHSERDPLVKVGSSIDMWLTRLTDMRVTELASRQGDWHIPWTLRPQEVLGVIIG